MTQGQLKAWVALLHSGNTAFVLGTENPADGFPECTLEILTKSNVIRVGENRFEPCHRADNYMLVQGLRPVSGYCSPAYRR